MATAYQDKSAASPARSLRPDSDSASETSFILSGDVSDRRDVDFTASPSRSEEYRLLFRLPSDEVLIEDFNCALQENILLQGHMYLFIHHICFYSNIFGFETKKTIPFHEITCVRKAKTVAIFPNAIEIVTEEKKHFFGSFLSRDEAYRLIIDGWAQHNTDVKALLESQEPKLENSLDSGIVIVERVVGSTEVDASSSADRVKDAEASEECKPLVDDSEGTLASENVSEYQESREDGHADHPSSRQSMSWRAEDLDAPEIPENFTMVIEAKFQVCVEDFFTLFISDRASDFLENFHRKCGDKDFMSTPWREHDQFGHARDLSFLHPVKVYIGAKMGRCQEVQKYRVYRNSHLVIETSQQVSDVPLADYFHVERIWDVEKNGNEDNSCILRVYFHVAFSKKTIFKGKIEQSTRDELREVHLIWINNAHELLKLRNEATQKGIADHDARLSQDQERVGSSSKLGLTENLHPTMTSSMAPSVVNVENNDLRIGSSVQESPVWTKSVLSFFGESWDTLLSYAKSRRLFPLYLAAVIVAILVLMQISIIILLTRVPEVHVVTQANQLTGFTGPRTENIDWLEKRVDYLKEEMLMVETWLERMRHEHAMLRVHLESLEKFRHKS